MRDPGPTVRVGKHLLADLSGCARDALNDRAALEALAVRAVEATGGTVLGVQAHAFSPHGVTVVVLVAESHLSLHTWPEHDYCAFDYFTCGERIDPRGALEVVHEALRPTEVEVREIPREARGPR